MARTAIRHQRKVRRRHRPVAGTTYDRFAPHGVSGLVLWLDCQRELDAGNFVDGGAIGQLTDWSGSGNHATQSVAGNKPVFKTGITGGRPVARFTAASSHYLSAADNNVFSPFVNDITVFAVAKANDTTTRSLLGKAAASNYELCLRTAATGTQYSTFQSDGGTHAATADAATVTNWNIYSATHDYLVAINTYANGGTPSTTGTFTGVMINGTAALTVGQRGDSLEFFDGDIAELIMFNAVLSAADHNTIGLYLAYKYGLTWTAVS